VQVKEGKRTYSAFGINHGFNEVPTLIAESTDDFGPTVNEYVCGRRFVCCCEGVLVVVIGELHGHLGEGVR